MAFALHRRIDGDVAAFVFRHAQARHDRAWNDSGREDDCFRFDRLAGQVHLAGLDGSHEGIRSDIGPRTRAEHPRSVVREARVDLGHDPVCGLEQDGANLAAIDVFVQRHDRVDERGQLAE